MKLLALNLPTDAPFLLEGLCALLLFYLLFIMIVFQIQNVHLQLAIGGSELPNAACRKDIKGHQSSGRSRGRVRGSGPPIRPDTSLRLKSLQRQDRISLFNWLNFLMKRVSYFATKLNSSDIQKCDCLWVPSVICKAVFPAPTATSFHRLRNTYSSMPSQ